MQRHRRHTPIAHEPALGWVAALLGGALLAAAVAIPKPPYTPAACLMALAARLILWGVAQIGDARQAAQAGTTGRERTPLVGYGVGFVFLGLLFAGAASLLYLLVPEHRFFSVMTGLAAALTLAVGAIVGIRRREWRRDT